MNNESSHESLRLVLPDLDMKPEIPAGFESGIAEIDRLASAATTDPRFHVERIALIGNVLKRMPRDGYATQSYSCL